MIVLLFNSMLSYDIIIYYLRVLGYTWNDKASLLEYEKIVSAKLLECKKIGFALNVSRKTIMMGSEKFYASNKDRFPIQIEVK